MMTSRPKRATEELRTLLRNRPLDAVLVAEDILFLGAGNGCDRLGGDARLSNGHGLLAKLGERGIASEEQSSITMGRLVPVRT
mgnify:CR=1 FL=1